MNLSKKNMLPLLIFVILAVRQQAIMAADRPGDDLIKFWVTDAIAEDLHMDASGITVDVSEGIVTLSGTVRNIAARKYADLEAKKIRGVLGVIDNLEVEPSHRWDTDIAQDVRHRIINSVTVQSHDIDVSCSRGIVEITGSVTSQSEREEAGLLASEVRGVKDVQNYLSVIWHKERSDEAIEEDVVAALRRDVYLINPPINVSVENGVVTLSGIVGSEYQKTRAAGDVRWINNVRGLDNKLKVVWWEREGMRTATPFPKDDDLRKAVRDELLQDSRIEPQNLVVKVLLGHVTIEGFVDNTYQLQIAGVDARNVVGVGWVTNHMSVRPVKRDDSEIWEEVAFQISDDVALWNQNIDVKVNDGIVTLSGKVDTGPDRVHATTVASRIRGVKKVVNNIRVNWSQEYADATLLKKIWDRIRSNWLLSPVKDRIKVNVSKGIVTLSGTVYNWGEHKEIENIALKSNGVRFVDNQVHVKGYDYHYEDWKIPDPNAPSWNWRDIDPYED